MGLKLDNYGDNFVGLAVDFSFIDSVIIAIGTVPVGVEIIEAGHTYPQPKFSKRPYIAAEDEIAW